MIPENTVRNWARLLYFLSQNVVSLIGVVLTTSAAITMIAFWIYDFMLPGPPHPYIGILIFLILPGLFVLGLLLIPLGILLRRKKLRGMGELPVTYPEIDLRVPQGHDLRLACAGGQRQHNRQIQIGMGLARREQGGALIIG